VIPDTAVLEQAYPADEVVKIEALRSILAKVKDEDARNEMGRLALRRIWDDELTYIERTHLIKTKDAVVSHLVLNYAQRRFYHDCIVAPRRAKMPVRSIVLKARQLGFSTLIQSLQYEWCDREGYRTALTISYDDVSTKELFAKASFVHKNMWFPRTTRRASNDTMEFTDNGSTCFARTSGNFSAGRGDTFHHLHASEIPMWQDPDETLTSVLQAVPETPASSIFFESTAKGAQGAFYDAWRAAESGQSDFIPFFAPWYWDPAYVIQFAGEDQRNAFARTLDHTERRLLDQHRITLEQLAWRRHKIRNALQGSEAKFRQEFPSSATEAFLTTGSPVFNADTVADLEQNAERPIWRGNILLKL